jgi:hypothetical protein
MPHKTASSLWSKIKSISPWYFLALFIISLTTSIYALRQNNLTMIRLRDKVAQVDKANGDIEAALRNLREFVYGHMNTDLATNNQVKPPIQLKFRYERLVQAQQDKLSTQNTQIYTQAQAHCEKLYPESFSGGPRVPCIQDYVVNHGVNVEPIPDALYKFDFVSPRWSPDLAGWSLVASALFLGMFIVGFSLRRVRRKKFFN